MDEMFEDDQECTWRDVVDSVATRLSGKVRKNLGGNETAVIRSITEICTELELDEFAFSTDIEKLTAQVFNIVSHQNGAGKSHVSVSDKKFYDDLEGKKREQHKGYRVRSSRLTPNKVKNWRNTHDKRQTRTYREG